MSDFNLKTGDLLPSISATLKDATGAPIDLTGGTVRFRMRLRGSSAGLKVDAAATIVSPAAGTVRYDWAGSDTDTAGVYVAEFRLTLGGKQESVPNANHLVIEVHAPV